MTSTHKSKSTPLPRPKTPIEKEYDEIIRRGKEQQSGINEILELYGEFQKGFKQSQEYLQFTEPIVFSSSSNTSERAL